MCDLNQCSTVDTEKLAKVSLQKLLKKQLARLDADKLRSSELKIVTSRFRESKLVERFSEVLTEQLQQAGVETEIVQKLTEQVS